MVLTFIGASLLWVGWFGFNAGSAVSSGMLAGMAMMVTHMATAVAAFTWMIVEWMVRGKPTVIGICTGAVAGLVAITPASGFVGPIGAVCIGAPLASSAIGLHRPEAHAGLRRRARRLRRARCWRHRGRAAHRRVCGRGLWRPAGLFDGNAMQVLNQLYGVLIVFGYDAIVSLIILKIVDIFIGCASPTRSSARVSISRSTARPYTDGIRLGRRPGTALAVEGPQRKLGPLTFWRASAVAKPPVARAPQMRVTDRWLIASLPGRTYGRTSLVRRVLAPLLSMFMTAAERESPPAPARQILAARRSCGCANCWAITSRASPAISLAVGEPQHAVPAFVGPVLAGPYRRVRPLPHEQGHRRAVRGRRRLARRRFALPRAIDPGA
jgi:hypothetical protein